jgi:DNA-binding helix-hairpin-helix protein with protein kinase domain
VILICSVLCEMWASRVTAALRNQRLSEREAACKKVEEVKQLWTQEASDRAFVARLHDLENIRDQAKQLSKIRAAKLRDLQSRVRESQLRAYLDQFHIAHANIPGIGAGRAAKLSAFGIDTAADVTRTMSVQGFGPVYMQRLLEWRAQLELRFRFDLQKGVDRRDIDTIEQEFQRELRRCAGLLDSGPRMLNELANQVVNRRQMLQKDYSVALLGQLRAEADLKVL